MLAGIRNPTLRRLFRRDGAPQIDRVAFLHIPKSAGSSVSMGLELADFKSRSLGLYDGSLFGSFDEFDTIHEVIRSKIIHLPLAHFDPSVEVVSGHLSLPTIRTKFAARRVFTVMREPRSRMLSQWLYLRTFTREQLSNWGAWADHVAHADCPLGEFLTNPHTASRTDNVVTRMLLGKHRLIPTGSYIPHEADVSLLADARRAVATLDFVGINEDKHLDRKISDFLKKPYDLPRTNVTLSADDSKQTDISKEMDPTTLEAIYSRSRLDRVLWDDVVRKLSLDPASLAESAFLQTIFRHIRQGINHYGKAA